MYKRTGKHFNVNKEKDWFNRQDIKDVIYEIDKTVAVKDEYLESPVFGGMSPDRLSQGCKAVILLYVNPTCNVYASRCGNNCVPSILRLAEDKDVIIALHHIMRMPKDIKTEFLDTGRVVSSREEYLEEYGKITGRF